MTGWKHFDCAVPEALRSELGRAVADPRRRPLGTLRLTSAGLRQGSPADAAELEMCLE